MKGKVVDLTQIRQQKKDYSISGVVPKLLNWKKNGNSWLEAGRFCRKALTGEYFYIPEGYIKKDNEIEVINKEGNPMYVSIDALEPFPQLYDTVKILLTNDKEAKHKVIPPSWHGENFDSVWEKKGILTYEPGNSSKLIIVMEDGLTWETNIKITE